MDNIRLRDLISEANKKVAWFHSLTKDILAKGYVDELVEVNELLLAALKMVRAAEKEGA